MVRKDHSRKPTSDFNRNSFCCSPSGSNRPGVAAASLFGSSGSQALNSSKKQSLQRRFYKCVRINVKINKYLGSSEVYRSQKRPRSSPIAGSRSHWVAKYLESRLFLQNLLVTSTEIGSECAAKSDDIQERKQNSREPHFWREGLERIGGALI